jgi:hypothetical protein
MTNLLDMFGDHAIHCKNGNIIITNAMIMSVLFSFLQTASIPATKEVVGYFAGKKSRVGDLVLPFGGTGLVSNSECLYDIYILSSLYNNRLNKSREGEFRASSKFKRNHNPIIPRIRNRISLHSKEEFIKSCSLLKFDHSLLLTFLF